MLKCDKHRLSGTPIMYSILYILHLNETFYVRCNFSSSSSFPLALALFLPLSLCVCVPLDKKTRNITNQIHITFHNIALPYMRVGVCMCVYELGERGINQLETNRTTKFTWMCVTFFFLLIFLLQRNELSYIRTRSFTHSCFMCECFFLFRSSSEIKYTFINRIRYYVLLFCVAKWHRAGRDRVGRG